MPQTSAKKMPSNWKASIILAVAGIALAFALLECGSRIGKRAGYTNFTVDYKQWLVREAESLDM